MEMRQLLLMALLAAGTSLLSAQEAGSLEQYRKQVIAYSQDIQAAGHSAARYLALKKSARADFLPQWSADARFNYTGHPLELTRQLPGMESPLHIQGKDTKYGATLRLEQPLYAGGGIRARYRKAQKEVEMAASEQQRVLHQTIYEADVCYWTAVAQTEQVRVAAEYQASVERLVEVVKHRVEVNYADRNDLLLTEVKLNEARYRLLQAKNQQEISRLELNSLAGIPFNDTLSIVPFLPALHQTVPLPPVEAALHARPELQMAQQQVAIQSSVSQMENAPFLPKFSIGIEGSYSSPGYDLTSGLSPNYAVYAQLSIPLFEWGKRKSTRQAGRYSVRQAETHHRKVEDQLRLEIETAYYSYTQAVEKVLLTESSLQKAAESEALAMSQYKEGQVSVVEAIDAQLYHQQAKADYIQSKWNAQVAQSNFERTIGRISK